MLYRFKVISNKYDISMGMKNNTYSQGYVTGDTKEEACNKLMKCYNITKDDIIVLSEDHSNYGSLV